MDKTDILRGTEGPKKEDKSPPVLSYLSLPQKKGDELKFVLVNINSVKEYKLFIRL